MVTASAASTISQSGRAGPLSWLNPVRLAAQVKRSMERSVYGDDFWSLYRNLELFVPAVGGPRQARVRLAFQAVGQSFPLLAAIADQASVGRAPVIEAEEFCQNDAERAAAGQLKALFDRYGSDKANVHDYHWIYGGVLTRMQVKDAMLEVGLGTNNESLPSNMGAAGKPGASLRAFRDFLPSTRIYGADIDRNILFEEERIKTFFIDQTDLASFREVEALGTLDLVIDDGLHSPNANLAILLLGIRQTKPGGWVVIEDILTTAMPVWQVVGAMLAPRFQTTIVNARGGLVFVAHRLS